MSGVESKRILVVGAGEAGRMVAAEIGRHTELEASVIGFLDDADAIAGSRVKGIPVLGRTDRLEEIVKSHSADEIIIAIPTAPGSFVRAMVERCRRAGVPFKIVPGVMEIIRGEVHIDQIRGVRVEDLLGRETVDFDVSLPKRVLSGKRILVTGAGGCIGSELCRQLAPLEIEELVLLGRGENRIFEIEEELRASHPKYALKTLIADLRDGPRIARLVEGIRPHVIYHAAAHKHVHYMERDPEEAVINNVEGSVNIIKAAESSGVERFVFISTDKAANPEGVMGATKRLIELYLRTRGGSSRCRFIIVRFGNVIGSTGSVTPLFMNQIKRGGPVTVSDPRATRYFMTVKEASLLVIKASVIGRGGEFYILDMGEALSILEIARDMIILAGYEPEIEIPIVFTGLREGEKLQEELVGTEEELVSLGEERILLARQIADVPPGLEQRIYEIIEAAKRGENESILDLISSVIPVFRGSGRFSSGGEAKARGQ